MNLEILGAVYQIPLKLMGSSSTIGTKHKAPRGPDALKQDFEPKRNFISEKEADQPLRKKMAPTQQPGELPKWLQESTTL